MGDHLIVKRTWPPLTQRRYIVHGGDSEVLGVFEFVGFGNADEKRVKPEKVRRAMSEFIDNLEVEGIPAQDLRDCLPQFQPWGEAVDTVLLREAKQSMSAFIDDWSKGAEGDPRQITEKKQRMSMHVDCWEEGCGKGPDTKANTTQVRCPGKAVCSCIPCKATHCF